MERGVGIPQRLLSLDHGGVVPDRESTGKVRCIHHRCKRHRGPLPMGLHHDSFCDRMSKTRFFCLTMCRRARCLSLLCLSRAYVRDSWICRLSPYRFNCLSSTKLTKRISWVLLVCLIGVKGRSTLRLSYRATARILSR